MDPQTIGDLLQMAIQVTFNIAAPMLITGLIVGVMISVVQAATQVNEVTLVFIPKMLGVGGVMWLLGPWMYDQLLRLVNEVGVHISHISSGGF